MKGVVLLRLCATTLSVLLRPLVLVTRRVAARRRLDDLRAALAFSVFLFAAVLSRAVRPSPELVALVPPSARIVAGLNVLPRSGQPTTFLMTTHYSSIDLNDFVAVLGVDASRAFDQIIIVASDGDGPYSAHSLMAIGRFNQTLIYRSVYLAGAKALLYRGIAILEIQPFARERDSFYDVRWLAMMDSKLAVFGTPALVRTQLDRYLDHVPADPSLERKLSHLRNDDVTWCVATVPEVDNEIRPIFRMLDSTFADLLRIGDAVQFGIRYGRQVEFEYEVNLASRSDANAIQRSFAEPVANQVERHMLSISTFNRVDGGVRGLLRVPKAQYEAWIAEINWVNCPTSTAHPRFLGKSNCDARRYK